MAIVRRKYKQCVENANVSSASGKGLHRLYIYYIMIIISYPVHC